MLFRQIINRFQNILGTNVVNPRILSHGYISYLAKSLTTPASYEIINEKEQKILSQKIIQKVNKQIASREQGRLFAVVQVAGKQFKITEGDVIVVEGYWPPTVGDKISLDKVLLIGGMDFSLIGRPLIESGLVNIYATVIEKTLSHTKTHFRKKRRKQYKRIHFYRVQQTMLRINQVQIVGEVNNPPSVVEVSHTKL
ncbi:hypothetical protein Trydic_g20905 [Trypoxylus dichotomus]